MTAARLDGVTHAPAQLRWVGPGPQQHQPALKRRPGSDRGGCHREVVRQHERRPRVTARHLLLTADPHQAPLAHGVRHRHRVGQRDPPPRGHELMRCPRHDGQPQSVVARWQHIQQPPNAPVSRTTAAIAASINGPLEPAAAKRPARLRPARPRRAAAVGNPVPTGSESRPLHHRCPPTSRTAAGPPGPVAGPVAPSAPASGRRPRRHRGIRRSAPWKKARFSAGRRPRPAVRPR